MKEPRTFYVGNSREKLLRVLSVLSSLLIKDDDDLEIEVRPRRKEKTHAQRKTWHALLSEWGRELGYTLPEMKNVAKRELMGTRWIKLNGKDYEIFPSSEDEDRFGYSELIDGTLRLAAETGVLLDIRRAA
jgi:hypothetical protein